MAWPRWGTGPRFTLSLTVAVTLCLGGCGTKAVWVKPGASEEDFARESYECEREARATAGARGPGLAGGGGLAASFETGGFQSGCLRRRGWVAAGEVPAESPPPAETSAPVAPATPEPGPNAPEPPPG